jgi:hypothetical protein
MGKSRADQVRHRRKVAGTPKGLEEHLKREERRGTGRPKTERLGSGRRKARKRRRAKSE